MARLKPRRRSIRLMRELTSAIGECEGADDRSRGRLAARVDQSVVYFRPRPGCKGSVVGGGRQASREGELTNAGFQLANSLNADGHRYGHTDGISTPVTKRAKLQEDAAKSRGSLAAWQPGRQPGEVGALALRLASCTTVAARLLTSSPRHLAVVSVYTRPTASPSP
jgi:hypothetical protein